MIYYRPIIDQDCARPAGAVRLAGGWGWFSRAERMERGQGASQVPADAVPADWLARLTAPRPPLAGMALDRPRLMGILNVTPDSFSDGGRFTNPAAALVQARAMQAGGADLIDIGGESTRPGAAEVPVAEELRRTVPVIAALRAAMPDLPISIDTRKAEVARAALQAGAAMVNDVSALGYDPGMAAVVASSGAPLCLMHAQGAPGSMQDDPRYGDVLLDVYDAMAARIAVAEAAGIPRARIVIDPGIGFGKTTAHNLALIRGVALFHGLGCAILIGASRKRFIGVIGGADTPDARMPGSVAVALACVAQGVQILRVHDVGETRQALAVWHAIAQPEGTR